MTWSNESRGRVKTSDTKFGNDQIVDVRNFDELRRWIWMVKKRVFTWPLAAVNIRYLGRLRLICKIGLSSFRLHPARQLRLSFQRQVPRFMK